MSAKLKRRRRRHRNPVSRKVSAKVSRHLLARDARARAAYPRTRSYRRARRRRFRRNPAGKAAIAAIVGAGLAALAWKAYVNSRGEGAHFGDPVYMGVIGAGGVVGYLVGGKV